MTVREAACRCGALTARCVGEPVRVSVCHCRECQRRTGSAFAVQARWPTAAVTVAGDSRSYERQGASGGLSCYQFCPACGSTVTYTNDVFPGLVAVPVGAFADPGFPPPTISSYEERRHPWVMVGGEGVVHHP